MGTSIGTTDTVAIRRPISMTRWKACSPQVPDVLIAKGKISTPVVKSEYFCDIIASIVAAAEPARVLLARSWDTTNVSGKVASDARQRSGDQGTCVTPSGRLPLLLHSECGSRVAWLDECTTEQIIDLVVARVTTGSESTRQAVMTVDGDCLLLLLIQKTYQYIHVVNGVSHSHETANIFFHLTQ